MLYKKNQSSRLDPALFRNPTSEYRAAPFWGWNNELKKERLVWQLETMKQMGLGGAHIHPRAGMATPYLGEEYMDMVKACVEKAKAEDMLLWLYDEDRAPSGAAGGLATKEKRYRARHLLLTPKSLANASFSTDPGETDRFLACYDVQLDESGCLKAYRQISPGEKAAGDKWYAYLRLEPDNPWYNNQAYLNTLDKKAVDHFIEVTYDAYAKAVSEEFGKTIPAIFTDEPQFAHKKYLNSPFDKTDVTIAWTDDLPETYKAAYPNEDLLASLPELIWERDDGVPSLIRYHYHDHVCDRFNEAFTDNIGAWCQAHGIGLTGHLEQEPQLLGQTKIMGEAMRGYRKFDIPGIDALCHFEYTTAKQAQSATHQYGREGMLSELYGVARWDFDFRDYKIHGDWQAALGVTIRVPHLALVGMRGTAKRDYPAPISYQSPWWKKHPYIEDHFSRVATAMTRGKPLVKVGVIHPIESCWLSWGNMEQTGLRRDAMEENFQNLTQWLLFGGIDFDFISESLLPEQCSQFGAPLQVGQMAYDAVVVPNCQTLRSTTLERLEAFQKAGGRLIFTGETPTLVDAIPDSRGTTLAERSLQVPFARGALLEALAPQRLVELRDQTGSYTGDLLHQFRQDGEGRWLFLAHGKYPQSIDIPKNQDVTIRLKGIWKPTLYDTQTGEIKEIPYTHDRGSTVLLQRMYGYDSLLLWLEPTSVHTAPLQLPAPAAGVEKELPLQVPFTLDEPNVYVLDKAEFSLDDGPWQPEEEILRLDNRCRVKLGWLERMVDIPQPWVTPNEDLSHTIHLRWHIHSQIPYENPVLAIERPNQLKFRFNGMPIEPQVTGYYVDKDIKTIPLPCLRVGENILEADVPIGTYSGVEYAYILGNFGVECIGQQAVIVPAPNALAFGDITRQGLPFYGGNITYHIPVTTNGGALTIRAAQYRGGLQTVQIDDEEQPIIYPPYSVTLEAVPAGEHTVHLTLYGHRRNSFGPIHNSDIEGKRHSPLAWFTKGNSWSYDYCLVPEGTMRAPVITEK